MSKFHSTVSRRTFMKGLGFGAAGIGAAAATAPVFHDLDELASSPGAVTSKTKWWMKEVDEPTVDIDWSVYTNYPTSQRYKSPDAANITARRAERQKQSAIQNISGTTLKDLSLADATRSFAKSSSFLAPSVTTPADRGGVPIYQGSADEAHNIVRSALHYMGAPHIGVVELDEHTRKFFYAGGTRFEDVDQAYEDGNVKVVPNKVKYAIVYLVKQSAVMSEMSHGLAESGPGKGYAPWLGKASVYRAYSHGSAIMYQIQKFVAGLGYQALKISALPVPFGIMSGLGETGRVGYVTSPEYGNMVRETYVVVTDLPLASTKPIDGGVHSFCKNCKTCAKNCPPQAIPMDTEPSYQVSHSMNAPGIKRWYLDWGKCIDYGSPRDCQACMNSCPLNSEDIAGIHSVVRPLIGTAPFIDGFLARMGEFMGYRGGRDGETWWNRNLEKDRHDNLYEFGTRDW